jgi:hypothetical protein
MRRVWLAVSGGSYVHPVGPAGAWTPNPLHQDCSFAERAGVVDRSAPCPLQTLRVDRDRNRDGVADKER